MVDIILFMNITMYTTELQNFQKFLKDITLLGWTYKGGRDGYKMYGFGSYRPTPPIRKIDFNLPSRILTKGVFLKNSDAPLF